MTFPTAVDSFTSLTAHVTRAVASDITALQTAIVNTQTTLTGVKGGTRSYIPMYSVRTANVSWGIWTNSSLFAGGPDGANTVDDTFGIGYNPTIGGVYDNTKPTLAEGWEASYFNGSKMIMERNFSFTNTVAKSSYTVRPFEFAINQEDSVSAATAVSSWQFRIGHAAGSFFRIGNPNVRDDLFEFTPAGVLKIFYAAAVDPFLISPSKIGSNSVLTFSNPGGEGTPYFAFSQSIGLGGNVPTSVDLKATTSAIATLSGISAINGNATGTGGVLITNPYNYGVDARTLSGGKVLLRFDIGATPYYIHVYDTVT